MTLADGIIIGTACFFNGLIWGGILAVHITDKHIKAGRLAYINKPPIPNPHRVKPPHIPPPKSKSISNDIFLLHRVYTRSLRNCRRDYLQGLKLQRYLAKRLGIPK